MTSTRASRVADDNGRMGSQGPRGGEPKRRRAFSASDKLAHLEAYERAVGARSVDRRVCRVDRVWGGHQGGSGVDGAGALHRDPAPPNRGSTAPAGVGATGL